ncbi:hypothetical protein [Acetobacter tropicalis]|uniref:hypothetical protein n=1 Tax=Acetobacter tropicalis TaxID=104102 RepID=UPI0011BDBDB8|nr:hypothetical protein [Acetobacter tropicalis]
MSASNVKRKVMRTKEATEYLALSVSAFRALAIKELESIKITEGRKETRPIRLSRISNHPMEKI